MACLLYVGIRKDPFGCLQLKIMKGLDHSLSGQTTRNLVKVIKQFCFWSWNFLYFLLDYVIEQLAGIEVGDEMVIDGGMASFEIIERIGNDLRCKCTDSGVFLPRSKLSFWRDGKLFGAELRVTYFINKGRFDFKCLHSGVCSF